MDYEITGEFWRTAHHVVSRGKRRTDGLPVLLKADMVRSARPRPDLQREFELLRRLACSGIPRAIEIVRDADREYLVIEDQGLVPLAAKGSRPFDDLQAFFSLALALCDVLCELHSRDVVVGVFTPSTILVGSALREAQIADLSIAQRSPVDVAALASVVLSSERAAYMAPEQTGRINRSVDHRADLYVLGALLYEVLTGRPPFDTRDPLALVHSHIARIPRPPATIAPGVPEQLSRIIVRLLAKGAEDRYQSARGLKRDLEACRKEWSDTGSVSLFELGARDFPDRLLVPQRLYGRQSQLAALTRACDEALAGRPSLVLVAGHPGVGKTSFINELCRPIVREHGYFIAGKFDQVARNVPYGALIQAFRSLVWQVLAEKEEQLAQWRADLAEALGSNAGVVAAVIPEIEFIIGKQPPAIPLEGLESQNRFRYVFQRFVGTFARPDHALIVFLDDLQWADGATIELLQAILTDADQRPLLVIGAYRDNEVTPDHPLAVAVERLRSADARIERVTLDSLDPASLTEFLADTLRTDEASVAELATLIREKTDGNPFFVIQFLETLRQTHLIALDPDRGRWTFRVDTVAAAATTDNVVTLMTQRIERLSPPAQDVLRLAACIGNPFRWQTLLTATSLSSEAASGGLAEAIDVGLILPAEHGYESHESAGVGDVFAFLHDRVQQAAYALIRPDERAAVHLEVGRQLLADLGADVPEDRLFEVVNHLNVGAALVNDAAERLALARLNLTAARKARASAAYQAALGFLRAGIDTCREEPCGSEHALMFALHFEQAECLYLAGEFDDAERAHAQLLERAASKLDRAAVRELQVTLYENRSRYAEAMASGRQGLLLFGLALPDDVVAVERALERELEAIDALLGERTIASLVDLDVMADVEVRTAMRILTLMWAPVYLSGNQRLTSLISATMVRLSLAHGNTEDSAYGYVTHAITVGPVRRRFQQAYEWGELAIAVNERFGDTTRRAKVHQQIHAHVNLWRRPFEACVPHAREAMRAGLEAGDFAYAGYGAATESWPAFAASRDLGRFVRDYTPTLAFLAKINMSGFRDAVRVMLNWAMALQGRTVSPLSLSAGDFDEATFVARYAATAPLFMTIFRCAKLHLAVVFDETARGVEAVERAGGVTVPGTIWPVLEEFWGALARAAACATAPDDTRARYRAHIASAAASLNELAENCPENYRCFALLVAAELARVDGQAADAGRLYEQVITYAVLTGNVQQEALGHDLYGRALVAQGLTHTAAEHFRRAHRAYQSWGAAAKAQQLEQVYRHFLPTSNDVTDAVPAEAALAGEETRLTALDVSSVLKLTQAVASELELDGLQRKLLTIAVENAGAERGTFLELHEDDAVPVLQAVVENERVSVRREVVWDTGDALAQGIVRLVRRTRQDVVIGDTLTDERFAGLAKHLATARSVLCAPIAHQGRTIGILYLEHPLSGTFDVKRIEIVRILATQAAIAFENARLYEDMKSEVARRASAERALRDALAELETLKNRLEAENVYLQEEIETQHNFNEIIGNSPALLQVLHRVERVAPTESAVLILGETGSGKELFARAIHSRSKRSVRPLVKVNCGAIAPGLVESELFGHVKGAFTGAIDKRVGRFELANGGTIFLDEIGELPLDAQVKLLRVLQEQEFEPVGSSRTVRVSVRVIAATNRNLDHAVREGKFRADLLYRLNVFPIEIPPLCARPSDIPLLTGFFLSRIARAIGKPVQAVSARSMAQMQQYSWPGNVRELQNVLERSAILAEGPIIDLEGEFRAQRSLKDTGATITFTPGPLDSVQREHILSVLRSTGGVVEGPRGAATILGMHPNTLRSRMKKLGIRSARSASPD